MIPDTAASLAALVFLVSPGLLSEWLRERANPGRSESAFRELSRIALVSVAANLVALVILAVVRSAAPDLVVDVGAWLRDGDAYLDAEYRLIARTAIGLWLLTLVIVFVGHRVIRANDGPATFVDSTVWHEVIRNDRPDNHVVWLQVTIDDGRSFFGYYSASERSDDGTYTIALKGPGLSVRAAPTKENPNLDLTQLDSWNQVYLPAGSVKFAVASYQPEAD